MCYYNKAYMKTGKLLIQRTGWFISGVMVFSLTFTLSAQNAISKHRADSLKDVLSQIESTHDKLPVLKELVGLYWQMPQEIVYLKEVIKAANEVDSVSLVYDSMSALCRYYYNLNEADSLRYWTRCVDSLTTERKEYPNALFMSHSLICHQYLWEGDYELAVNEAINLLNLAKKENQIYGLIRMNRDLGVIYQKIHRDNDAVSAFREGLEWMKKGKSNPTFEVMYFMDMIPSTLRMNLFEEAEELLSQYENVLDELEHTYNTRGKIFPVKRHRWAIQIYYTELYMRSNQLKKAKTSLEKAALYVNSEQGSGYVDNLYHRVKAMYYNKTGAYEKALVEVDEALGKGEGTEMMKLKVDILRSLKRHNEALSFYKRILQINDSVRDHAFSRQIAQLRVLHDLNGKEKQWRELHYQAEQISAKQRLILISVCLSFLLSALLYVLIRFYRRTHRLKNELQQEKDSLIESEKELRVTTDIAEKANRKKTAFIASISHEVRTPLNAIVGFSELLIDETYDEADKKGFAEMINNSSELLLNLINDVLDLSRLESGRTSFVRKPTDIVACCRRALESIEHRVAPGVQLLFTCPVDSYSICTDALRVEQLLVNLLSNAAKFTEKGEIRLTVRIDPDKKQLVLSVTDTGCGIPVDMHTKIFERFEKLDEFKQGTGLGLCISQIIAERLQGSLFIDSSYTGGARFVFIHPLEP